MSNRLSRLHRQGTTGAALVSLVAGGMALCVTPARAQEASPPAADQATETEAIVVTARKRAETLQDVSAPLSVVDSSLLERRQVNDVGGLQTLVPTVTIGETVGMLKINVRGLGNTTNTRSEDSDVVMYVDGAVVSRMEAQALAFFDLERVEVLRGPQERSMAAIPPAARSTLSRASPRTVSRAMSVRRWAITIWSRSTLRSAVR
ncbi:MAG: TonB-dependent receptor plug domain-containing protein [Sphingobium sp.]|uniref:TonB-dependent receptor plug domain-containing protein n=1 Tax=Sphingobium sp. TaxID=1912891 RepID=UPI0029B256EF|nr:TonB-dependent receptor plug domain-containing protein [Sphingobium sp.]MDX3909547.1 TonB-dependent receptor plug domain-containing protein [Sphingobium sp.]